MSSRGTRGFTLIELMLVVALIGILATLAVGLSGNWRRRQEYNSVRRAVYNALSLAHAEAQRRNRPVHVAIATSSIRAFLDENNDDSYTSGETVISLYPASGDTFPSSMTLVSDFAAVGSPAVDTAIFDGRGFSVTAAGTLTDGTVTVTDAVLSESGIIDTTIAGAVRVQR